MLSSTQFGTKFMKILVAFCLLSFLLQNVYSSETSWETLKTLENDPKTKSPVAKGELKKIIGKEITIKGFMMPLDYDSKAIVEFLLMPYVPACMHVPPPPANQLILVKMKKGTTVAPSFYPVEMTGVLTIDANKDLESSYKLEGLKLKEIKESK
jgi:hypothetical protein